MTDSALRVPPHSVEAEQAVLGGVLIDNGAWDRIADILTGAHFYRGDHRAVFDAVAGLCEDGQPCDAVTVAERLDRDGQLESSGGLAYLAELTENTPSAVNIVAYAEIVREKAVRREAIKCHLSAAEDLRKGGDPTDEQLAAFGIEAAAAGIAEWPALTAGALMESEDDAIEWLIHELLPKAGTSLLFADPKAGKSTLARLLAAKVASGGRWNGHAVKKGAVVYLALDERRATVRESLRTLATAHPKVKDAVHVAFAPRRPLRALETLVERIRPALVVVDTLVKAIPPLEDGASLNDYGGGAASVVAPFERMAAKSGAHFMLVHHARKGATDPNTAALGSTRLAADVDVLLHVTLKGDRRYLTATGRDGVRLDDIDVTHAEGASSSGNGAEDAGREANRGGTPIPDDDTRYV